MQPHTANPHDKRKRKFMVEKVMSVSYYLEVEATSHKQAIRKAQKEDERTASTCWVHYQWVQELAINAFDIGAGEQI